jgi:hypothetical protein
VAASGLVGDSATPERAGVTAHTTTQGGWLLDDAADQERLAKVVKGVRLVTVIVLMWKHVLSVLGLP